MDEFVKTVSHAANGSQVPSSEQWVSAGNGYAMNKATGEAKQLYDAPQSAPKLADLPVDDRALGTMMNSVISSKELDLSKDDALALSMDLKARASELMRSGVDPSVAVQKAYDALSPGISVESSWKGDEYKYNPLALSDSAQAAPAAQPSAPNSAVAYLKENNTPEMRAAFKQKYGYLP